MKKILFFCCALLAFGCKNEQFPKENLRFLNGYWEIDEVIFPDGSKKDYGMSPSIDFIQTEGLEGYRKKMQPKFDGSYSTSNNLENFTILEANDTFILNYKNELSQREEKLVHLDSLSFSVKSQDGVLYLFKRFQPISIPK